jgi:hypothetical protein
LIYLSGHVGSAFREKMPGLGVLVTPHGGLKPDLNQTIWAVDTGCFTQPKKYTRDGYIAFLKERRYALATCLFATAPDVVGDAAATWNRARDVLRLIRVLGYPAAFVAQDGIEREVVHWDAFDVLFLGGSTKWKLSHHARDLAAEANRRGLLVHMGRVNSFKRLATAKMWGCGSADGTFLAFAPTGNLARIQWWLDDLRAAPPLNFGGDPC